MKDTIIILGSHPRTRGAYDWQRTDADVWVFNEACAADWLQGKTPTAVFQLHQPAIWRNPNNRNDPNHLAWLRSGATPPILMQEHYDEVPQSVKFPREYIIDLLIRGQVIEDGRARQIREVSCTPAWAVAYAIYLGYKKIEIYGVELESATEYHYQQGSFKFWLGYALGRGIKVEIHSRMFDNPQYGYDGEVEIPLDDINKRIAELRIQIIPLQENYKTLVTQLNKQIAEFTLRDNTPELKAAVKTISEAGAQLAYFEGALQANQYYAKKAADMITASEKFVFSRQEFEHNQKQAQINAGNTNDTYHGLSGQLVLLHNRVAQAAKDSAKRRKLIAEYDAAVKRLIDASNTISGWKGAADENGLYCARLDAGIKAAGGVKSEQAILGG